MDDKATESGRVYAAQPPTAARRTIPPPARSPAPTPTARPRESNSSDRSPGADRDDIARGSIPVDGPQGPDPPDRPLTFREKLLRAQESERETKLTHQRGGEAARRPRKSERSSIFDKIRAFDSGGAFTNVVGDAVEAANRRPENQVGREQGDYKDIATRSTSSGHSEKKPPVEAGVSSVSEPTRLQTVENRPPPVTSRAAPTRGSAKELPPSPEGTRRPAPAAPHIQPPQPAQRRHLPQPNQRARPPVSADGIDGIPVLQVVENRPPVKSRAAPTEGSATDLSPSTRRVQPPLAAPNVQPPQPAQRVKPPQPTQRSQPTLPAGESGGISNVGLTMSTESPYPYPDSPPVFTTTSTRLSTVENSPPPVKSRTVPSRGVTKEPPISIERTQPPSVARHVQPPRPAKRTQPPQPSQRTQPPQPTQRSPPPVLAEESSGIPSGGHTTPIGDPRPASPPALDRNRKMNKLKIKPFRRLIRDLGNLLSNDEVMDLALLADQPLDLMESSEAFGKPFQRLMASLEKQAIVGENNIDDLIVLLEEIKAEEAVELVQIYRMSLTDASMDPLSTQDAQSSSAASEATNRSTNHPFVTRKTPRDVRRSPPKTGRSQPVTKTTSACDELKLILESIGIHGSKEFTVNDSMTLETIHLTESYLSKENVVMAFLSQLMSYDYRSVRIFKTLAQRSESNDVARCDHDGQQIQMSCRDICSAIIDHCDAFLKQDVLSKMSSCQLAVPILFSEPESPTVTFQLWALQKITKAWKDPVTSVVHEESVVDYPFPVVTSLRLGNPDCSKSNIVNKMLGSVQGNDEHPYFASREHESCRSVLSNGHMEGVWYLPSGSRTTKHTLNRAICFMNLRGDGDALTKQVLFIRRYSTVIVVFVSKKEVLRMLDKVGDMCKESKVIVVMSSRLSPRWKGDASATDTLREQGVSVIDADNQSVMDQCENICIQINAMLSSSSQVPGTCLADMFSFCNDVKINVDISNPDCFQAKKSVDAMLQECRANPKKYKSRALPLQLKWQKWSELDKDRSWKGAHGNVEKELSKCHRAKEEQRRMQREIGMSKEMRSLYDELRNSSAEYKKFFIHWFQHDLNETSFSFLRPLADDLKTTRDNLREKGAEITRLQRKMNGPTLPEKERKSLQAKIQDCKTRETELREKLSTETRKLDASSLGFEHFVREFGQVYECFHNVPCRQHRPFDVSLLPKLAAEMLLSGHPLEIFDGDTCHVPLKWVKGVLSAVRGIIGEVSVYVISVIGIQSSGKSTLLNSMFGVRFAVSAGRCTRGVFLQLLPIAANLKKLIGFDYVAVIDTEGLKAPEKAVAERKSEDNELATFALCLSDMTLINIGGQTVGEDLSNILQIAAHAFIRMKEVHLRSSCYLVQQFVADITAQHRNQTSTQSILEKLDQAVLTAAVEERQEDQYRQFSDCFNMVNIDTTEESVQYVPSLWRGSMCSPNHDYSETVVKLKSALLKEIKSTTQLQRISEFGNRIGSVWEAVKQEDFVFNFRNTNEIAQYSNFSQMFKRKQLQLTQEMMKWELNAKQTIRSTSAENILAREEALFRELDEKISLEMDNTRTYIEETLQKRDFESVRLHATFFYRDLELVERNSRDTIRSMIQLETAIVKNADTKQTQLLPQLKANLKRQVLPVAEILKRELSQGCTDMSSDGITIQIEDHVRDVFEEEWEKQMKTITLSHPTSTKEGIKAKLESDITMCVMEALQHTGLSKEMKELMAKRTLFDHCHNSPKVQSTGDIPKAHHTMGDCTGEMSKLTDSFIKIVDEKCENDQFRFSREFITSLREPLKGIIFMPCTGCGDKTVLLLCLCSRAVQIAHDSNRDNILNTLMKNKERLSALNQDDIATHSEIRETVQQCLADNTLKQTSIRVSKSFSHLGDKVLAFFTNSDDYREENVKNQLRINLCEMKAKCKTGKWYSLQITKDFINMVQDVLKRQQVSEKKRQHLLREACSVYIEEATRSEREALSRTLQWSQVQKVLKIESTEIGAQMKMFAHDFRNTLPPKILEQLRNLTADDIAKYAGLSISHKIRHILDERFVPQLPMLSSEISEGVLLVVRESLNIFLGRMQESGTHNTIMFRSTITELLQELDRQREFGKAAHVVCVAYLCSWVLPICVNMQYAFDRENSIQASLEKEKGLLYEDFKALCGGTCLDHLAAKSLCSIISDALKATLKNQICTVLFERLFKINNIFCSRPHFLQAVLENLCEEEIFENYAGYIRHHSSFIQTWTLNFIVEKCSASARNRILIEDIVFHEVGELIRKTEESLNATMRRLANSDEDDHSFVVWIQEFGEHFKRILNATLNEKDVAEMMMYATVSDYSLFTEECKSIVADSLREALLNHADIPDIGSRRSIKEWFEGLPKKLHLLLSQSVQGCGARCPFCKALCDDTVKEHNVHVSNLHYPAGVGGMRNRRTKKLTCHTCVASVASESRCYYTCRCEQDVCEHEPRPFREYKKDYPGWEIQPIANYEATMYWKWVLGRFNAEFARYYRCQMADIPWDAVTKEEALTSIRNINS